MKTRMNCTPNQGFTLLELMVALSIFALIASVCYAALVPAGKGFRMLQAERDQLESSYQMDRRLRMDVTYLLRSADKSVHTLEITHDQRGEDAFDTLTLLISDQASLAPVQVHYALDEDSGYIVRQSQALWMREKRTVDWQMQQAVSFEVQALVADDRWVDVWGNNLSAGLNFTEHLPKALRIRWRADGGLERELVLPLFIAGDVR